MKKLSSLLLLTLVAVLGSVLAQTPMQNDSMRKFENNIRQDRMSNRTDTMHQDSDLATLR